MTEQHATRIYTEDQFPLDEQTGDGWPADGDTFLVMVQWQDITESPSQAVARLNREAMVATHEANRRIQGQVETRLREIDHALDDYSIGAPDDEGYRWITHSECGSAVGNMHERTRLTVRRLVDAVRRHDCTAEARVKAKPEAARIAEHAAGFLNGSDADSVNEEYLRALAELVTDLAGLPVERKGEVGAYLWEQGGSGAAPHFLTTW